MKRCLFGLCAALLTLAGCDTGSPAEPGTPLKALPRPLTASEQQLIAAGNTFAFGLLKQVNAAAPDSNLFISPLSASLALGMTMNGAAGETFAAMRQTLGFGTLAEGAINRSYRDLLALLLGLDGRVKLQIANAIFYRQGFPVEPPFLDTTKAYFGAEVGALDFASPGALRTINGWAERNTNGRIPKVLDDLPPDLVMLLMNALYFKGQWTQQFEVKDTRDAPFHLVGGGTATVKMMRHAGMRLRYLRGEGFQAAELPYGRGAWAMTILLPDEGRDVNALLAQLDAARWQAITEAMREDSMAVELPRFRLEYEKKLNHALTRLGMGVAFGLGADFTRISRGGGLLIDFVKQNTFVEVNEEGTEAAAVTVVGIRVVSAPPSFRVDRPFLFAIRERLSGTILFVGKIMQPPAR